MGLACKISYSKGVAKVTDDFGQPSKLYQEVFNLVGDQEQALNVWATAYSKDFGAKGEDASVNDLVKYFDAKVSAESRLSPDEKLQVKDFMRRNGISSLNDLNVQLAKIFKPNGVLEIDPVAAANSGLYSQSEIKELNLDDIADILNKIEGQLILGDIAVEPYIQHHEHKNASKKTILGTYEKVPHSEIDMALIKAVDDFSDINSLYAGVKTLPYSDFVYDVLNNEQFAREVMDKFSGMRKIPRLSIVNGELQVGANHRYTTVKNTVLAVADNLVIESEIDFLETIRLDTWEENQEDIKKVLKEIEETLVGYNIDIIGLSENSQNRQEVMMLLEATNNLLKNVNSTTVANFASIHNLAIPQEENIIAQVLPEKYANYNIVSLHSEATETELFDRYGLIKVGDNLFHKVDQNADKNDVKDFIYGELIAGRVEIPSEYLITKDINNKERVLEDISKYLMSRQTTSQFANQELYSAYQVAFNHDALPKTTNHVGNLIHIRTDEEYLKSSFVSDFYNYILREKLKDSGTYRSTLFKFEITDRDITLTEEIDSISGLEFEQELSEYIALKKDSNMKYLLVSEPMISEDLLYLNFPQEKSEYEGTMIVDGEYIITEPIKDNYIKLNGEIYRKELVKDSAELFMRVVTIPNTLYYTSSTNFDLDRVQAKEALDKYGTFSPIIVSETNLKETVAKSRINDNMSPSLKELSTLKDKSYTVFKEGNSFVAYKDGNKVGEITYDVTPQGYFNPRVTMAEAHRSKGVGTELYLNLFDKASKENKQVSEPEVETPQSKNIFLRVNQQKQEASKELFTEIVRRLESTGLPKGSVVYGRSEFSQALRKVNSKNRSNAKFSDVQGFVDNGVIYINPSYINVNTPIHEVAHLWSEWARANKPVLYERGVQLISGTEYHNQVIEESKDTNSVYYNNSEEQILEEALVRAIGDKGESIVNENRKSSIKEWLSELWASINNVLGLSNMTSDQVQNLTLEEYTKAVNIDLLKGEAFENLTYREKLTRFQIIGERGAARLDSYDPTISRMNDLNVAMAMEKAGKSSKAIRLATGWEKGADSKWRYEIQDIELDVPDLSTLELNEDKFVGGRSAKLLLSDIATANELFTAYPTIKDTVVTFYESDVEWSDSLPMFEYGGSIFINLKEYRRYGRQREDKAVLSLRSGAVHELQHVIQSLEGFGGGTSEAGIRKGIERVLAYGKVGNVEDVKRSEYLRSIEYVLNSGRLSANSIMAINDPNSLAHDITLNNLAKFMYNNSYGEVEARNAEERLTMSSEERANKLLEISGKIANKDQIFIADFDISALSRATTTPKISIVEDMENVSTVFDSQLELLDLYSSKEEVEIQKKIDECSG